jgi:sugar phosphate isomerase/epimerase
MQFGLVLPLDAGLSAPTDFDYLEPDVAHLLKPQLTDDVHQTPPPSNPPVLAVHSLIPASLAVTGPQADLPALRLYVQRACERAARLGVRIITLSSPAALRFPEGFDPKQAKSQTLDFLRAAVPFFARYEIMLVAGVNPPDSSNMMTTLPEVLQYVWQVDHPWFQCLLDAALASSGLITPEQVNDALPWIRHVHVPPELENVEPVLAELKRARYQDLISVNPRTAIDPDDAARAVPSLRSLWERC